MVNFKEDYHKIKFKCKQCGNCCRGSKIRLSPYDILRLCGRLGLNSGEFLEKYAYFVADGENRGLLTCMLKTSPECLFLEEGCKVYEERPLGCRLFPLAIQPHFDGSRFESNVYVLEECAGFGGNKRISVGEFKGEQKWEQEPYEEWVKFKVKAINGNLLGTEGYREKFMNICYDFDSASFKEILKEEGKEWPPDLEERFKLILKLAEERLL